MVYKAVMVPDSHQQPLRVIIVDDHPTMRAGLRALIDDDPTLEVIGEAQDGGSALQLYSHKKPDVTIMDLQLPDMDGETVIKQIVADHPAAMIIALTTFDGADTIKRTLSAGARGFLTKDTARREIVDAIKRVHDGQRVFKGEVAERLADAMMQEDLTPRELDVLKILAAGNSNKSIAYKLDISESTVKIHLGKILDKLAASDRTEAVLTALKRGIIRIQ
ncbi:response regulator transcription factor [Sphingorhabdus sp. Alg231-15]|uniref:response regulator transcription factor n=1 Tax=Sphingorhabdus sp. Alg231-15 TaxID=1922222 RepID=UPI00307BC20E